MIPSRSREFLVLVILSAQGFALADCGEISPRESTHPPVDFSLDVLPLLTRLGCNSGACHGAAAGRGGFRLSLYGQDADRDWLSMTRELRGRRVDTVNPERSLLLRKAAEVISHGGGQRMEVESESWDRIIRWLADGAKPSLPSSTTVQNLKATLQQVPDIMPVYQVVIRGTFTDGREIDLSKDAIVSAADPSSVEISPSGLVWAKRPGRHLLTVRVRHWVASCELLAPFENATSSSLQRHPSEHLIDQSIEDRLRALKIEAPPRADPQTILRRSMIDVLGRLPTADEARLGQAIHVEAFADSFAATTNPSTKSHEFVEHWTYWLAKELRVDTIAERIGKMRAIRFRNYLRQQIAANKPLPEILAMLVGGGDPVNEAATGDFYWLANDGRGQAEVFSELVLGTRMGCANCHDHPLDRWTQDDFHGLAAIFAGVRRGDVVTWRAGETNTHPRTGDAAAGRLPDGQPIELEADPRPKLADWIRGPGRKTVARNWANRVWAHFFGAGLIEPVDDDRTTNPPSHPQLLDRLTDEWIRNGESLHWLIHQIVSSDVYREVREVEGATREVSGILRKPAKGMPLAVWLDAVADVTGVRDLDEEDAQAGQRFIQRVGLMGGLNTRNVCDAKNLCPTDFADSLAGRLALMNSPLLNGRLAHPKSRITQWEIRMEEGEISAVIEEIFLTCFGRYATEKEVADFGERTHQAGKGATREVLEDFVWSLLTSPQFGMH